MKIRFITQEKKEWGIVYGKTIKVLMISLYWFSVQISFGKHPFDAIAFRKFLKDQFDKNCEVCGKSLHVTNVGQIIKYHPECRHLR